MPLQSHQVALPQTHGPRAVPHCTLVRRENQLFDFQLTILQKQKSTITSVREEKSHPAAQQPWIHSRNRPVSKQHQLTASHTHQVGGVFGPHVRHQAVLRQGALKHDLDSCRVALLLFKVDVGLILCQPRRFCCQLHTATHTYFTLRTLPWHHRAGQADLLEPAAATVDGPYGMSRRSLPASPQTACTFPAAARPFCTGVRRSRPPRCQTTRHILHRWLPCLRHNQQQVD